ncbi:MAG: hypothetical protein HGA65_10905, partial [Oscillochloris sp.]|nr:hypothetical protein [Oscillochloris sp.]
MPIQAPKIDPRTYRQLIERTEQLARLYAGWQPYPDGRPDGGQALIRIFARMAEVLIERLNRVPEKNFFAFLDLIGAQILPPQAARVPLTFRLAAGSTSDSLVPARTQVAATPAPGDPGPVIFETERELVVTHSALGAVFVRQPDRDYYACSLAAIATGNTEGSFPAFEADTPTPHYLYLSHQGFYTDPRPKTIITSFSLNIDDHTFAVDWLNALRGTFWDGHGWQTPDSVAVDGSLVRLAVSPPVAARNVGGVQGTWLRAELLTTLPSTTLVDAQSSRSLPQLQRHGSLPDAGLAASLLPAERDTVQESAPIDFAQPFAPFGLDGRHNAFYLAWDEGFAKPGASVTINLGLDPQPAGAPDGGGLNWEYSAGPGRWQLLGQSSPGDEGGESFQDTTGALSRSGQVSFSIPVAPPWAAVEVQGQRRHWLRACVLADGTSGFGRAPIVRRLALGYDWALPGLSDIFTRIEVTNSDLIPEAGFTNQTQLDLTKDLLPFGEKPRVGESFYLACGEAFVAETTVTLTLTLGNPRQPAPSMPERTPASAPRPTLPPVCPSPDLTIAWEYFNGRQWQPLLTTTSFPSDPLIDDFDNPTEATRLTLTGQCLPGSVVQIQERFTGQVQASAIVSDTTWKADFDLGAGLHALHVSALLRGSGSVSRWLLVFSGKANAVPAPLAAKVELRTLGQLFVTGTTTAGSQVIVHNAATNRQSPPASVDASGAFAISLSSTTDMQAGRNDLLVVATNVQGQVSAFIVLTQLIGDSSDTTWGFTRSGKISFRMPKDAATTSVNGQAGRWLRVRITQGNYGLEARYEPLRDASGNLIDTTGQPSRVPIYQLIPATFQPPSVQTLKVNYVYNPAAQPVEHSLCG